MNSLSETSYGPDHDLHGPASYLSEGTLVNGALTITTLD